MHRLLTPQENDPDFSKLQKHMETCLEPWCVKNRQMILDQIAEVRAQKEFAERANEKSQTIL